MFRLYHGALASTTFRYRDEHIAMRVGQSHVGHGMRNHCWDIILQSKIRVWQRTRCKHFIHVPEKLPHFVQNGVLQSLTGCSQSHTKASMLKASGTKLACRASKEEMIRNAAPCRGVHLLYMSLLDSWLFDLLFCWSFLAFSGSCWCAPLPSNVIQSNSFPSFFLYLFIASWGQSRRRSREDNIRVTWHDAAW